MYNVQSTEPDIKTRRSSPVDSRPSTAEAPPIGKISFSKIAINLCDLDALQDLESPKNGNIVYFVTESTI